MKNLLSTFLILFVFSLQAQIEPGFNKNEARDLIQLCNSFTYLDLYGNDAKIIPFGYVKTYTSPTFGMDNLFQVYRKGNTGVIVFRGSTKSKISWLENLYSSMIPVKDKIEINDEKFKYKVGKDTASAVHAGYMLAISYLEEDVRRQIKTLNKDGVYDIFLTGHSQGGALAQLMRVYLDDLSFLKVRKRNTFKVYAFAPPMIGNTAFAKEYQKKFGENQMSFTFINPSDFVPKMPISFKKGGSWEEQLTELMMDSDGFDAKESLMNGLMNLFKGNIEEYAQKMSKKVNEQLMKDLGTIVMPAFKKEIDYQQTGNVIMIVPTVYPKGSDMKGWSVQHKPYNYYTAILKEYFLEDYKKLDQKYFVMPKK